MNTVFIVPTGIGASIGGHSGDATPAFNLIASVSDIAITHPNVVNASNINEMSDNCWYVEGSMLDRFLEGQIELKKPKSNKILMVTNKPIQPEIYNAVNAAIHTIGCDVEFIELDVDLEMVAELTDQVATGKVYGWRELVEQVSEYDFDALAIATQVNVPKEIALHYFKHGGVNPWGGVEAVGSKLIAEALNKPVAHAPVDNQDPEVKFFNQEVPPRIAAEVISQAYIHCVFKGLHKAPRVSNNGLSVRDIDCMVTPLNCYGRPHRACMEAGIPIIAVAGNKTNLEEIPPEYIQVDNYLEAVGYIQLLRTGISFKSVKNN